MSNATLPADAAFTVFYCELQTWGAHRCKSKVVASNEDDESSNENEVLDANERATRQYSTVIGNLRMATKYLFHVKWQAKAVGERRTGGRADLGDNELGINGNFQGQTIIIPTKGCKCKQFNHV